MPKSSVLRERRCRFETKTAKKPQLFCIFQFLWVWNDLLVALVFLGKKDEQIVLTSKLRELLGSRGDNWEILTSSAFISIVIPLIVFFTLQRYFVRGLVTGSVKS